MPATSSWAFEVEKLLAPISQEAPGGALLRYEGTYDRIQDARRSDDPHLAMGIWERDLKEADWNRVSEICLESLEKRTKDLQIAAWLLEAWIRLHGFPGAREGLRVINGLCQGYWETMYPSWEDPDYRLSIFDWINEKVSLHLKFIPLTDPPRTGNWVPYCFCDWETACRLEQAAGKHSTPAHDPRTAEDPTVTIAEFRRSVQVSPPQFYASLREDLGSDIATCLELEALLDGKYGKDGPSLRGFRNLLESIQLLIANFGQRRSARGEEVMTAMDDRSEKDSEVPGSLPDLHSFSPAPPIQSRAEAYQRLEEAAEYLLRTEPHSPTPYLVRKAIAWGNMTLDELLPELVRNEDALKDTLKLLQIETREQPPPQKGK